MGKKVNSDSSADDIKVYMDQIEILLPLGFKLLDFLKAKQPIQERNIIVYAFLRKIVRILAAIRCLIYEGFEEEAQILVRVLLETKINFEYFLIIANENYNKAFARVIDAAMLEKMKALESTDFILGEHHEDKAKWEKIEEEIKARYSDKEFKQLRRNGFSGVTLWERAKKTDNKDYYNLAYRLYSKHVHFTDLNEQLQEVLIPEKVSEYDKSRILALLEASFNCSVVTVYKCNDWLGKPIKMPV